MGDTFELDLALRNNITTQEHPLGVYHPHAQYHNIKKENIGLIEVMGLAVLPSRLKEELEILAGYLVEGKDIRSNEKIEKHAEWVERFLPDYDRITGENVMDILKKEVGNTFVHVLEDAGVYKSSASFLTASTAALRYSSWDMSSVPFTPMAAAISLYFVPVASALYSITAGSRIALAMP